MDPIDSVNERIGAWLSAALDDPKTCPEFRRDIRDWFTAQHYYRTKSLMAEVSDDKP